MGTTFAPKNRSRFAASPTAGLSTVTAHIASSPEIQKGRVNTPGLLRWLVVAEVLIGHGVSLPKTLGRLTWLARPLMWVDHLSVARCCAFIAEHNLAEAAALMGAGLHLLHRDLILETIWVELEKKDR